MSSLSEKIASGIIAGGMIASLQNGVQDIEAIEEEYDDVLEQRAEQTLTAEESKEYFSEINTEIEEIEDGLTAADDFVEDMQEKEEDTGIY